MFRLMLRKVWNKKWMIICLFIGNILLIAVAAGIPMYTQAVQNRVLTKELSNYITEHNSYPTLIEADHSAGNINEVMRIIDNVKKTQELFQTIPKLLGIDVKEENSSYYITCYNGSPVEQRSDDVSRKEVHLGCFQDFDEHISVVAGKMYSQKIENGIIEVLVSRKTLSDENLMLGEKITLNDVTDENKKPYTIRIAGVFDRGNAEDPYWVQDPNELKKCYIMPEQTFQMLFMNFDKPQYTLGIHRSLLLDYTQIKLENVEQLIEKTKQLKTELDTLTDNQCNIPFIDILEQLLIKEKKLKATLNILQVPVYVLLGIYIFMVSKQMIDMEKNEIAFFKSRGGSRLQIIKIYFYQSLLIAGISIIIGIPVGFLFCNMIGNTNSFLEFVGRTALKTNLNMRAILYSLAGTLFSIAVMVSEANKNTTTSIVMQKREKSRKKQTQLWKKAFFDVILLGVSLYGLYTYHSQKILLTEKVMNGASLDPLLFLSSVSFIIGSTLVALRFFPLLIKMNFLIVKKWCSASIYTSFRQILQTQHTQSFILLFLVLTISIGIFNANVARTINSNEDRKIRYLTGADLVVQEQWDSIATFVNSVGDGSQSNTGTYVKTGIEPDFDAYRKLEGVSSVTKVYVDSQVTVPVDESTSINNITLMGIHTKELGETVDFQEGLLPKHWYHYLNAMSQKQEGILVSQNFADLYGYQIGDTINYKDERFGTISGEICGFVNYWPSYIPVRNEKLADGTLNKVPQFLVIAQLSMIQSSWGVQPYQIWMKLKGSSEFFYRFANENGKKYTIFKDLATQMINKGNNPIFQGTNGILTLGFLIVLTLCAAGFLIYWITSIRSRTLQFGIYSAMGMSLREVLGMLIMEQIYLSGIPIAFGFFIGFLASKLYIPLIQISYTAEDQVIPLVIVQETGDILRVLILVILMLGLGILILGIMISKLKMVQSLKLGED
ncbi:MAG TPA: FtsX-like permease family protein [Mobilitalea sp.]|nr:FtsX-like permease family protein [Mobilitalea sp.]